MRKLMVLVVLPPGGQADEVEIMTIDDDLPSTVMPVTISAILDKHGWKEERRVQKDKDLIIQTIL